MELAEDEGVTLVGVTDASASVTDDYRDAQDLAFPILAESEPVREAWGIAMIWGNVVRLVDPEGNVVAAGLADAERVLAER